MARATQKDMLVDGELDDLLNLDHGLTTWEVDFVEDLEKWRERGKQFTEGQISMVRKVWNRRCK